MDTGIWAIWYELPEDPAAREAYFAWFHGVHVPEKLSRPGYLWAAHYELVDAGARHARAAAPLGRAGEDGPGRSGGWLALFGGVGTGTFLDPSPGQLKLRQTEETRRMIGLRQRARACILAEEVRVDGPDAASRAPGITPAPWIQMENFAPDAPAAEDDVGAWFAQQRLPFAAAMPGCVGARKLLTSVGWGRHAVLYEFATREAWEERFVAHEEAAVQTGSWSARVAPRLLHAPCSPALGRRCGRRSRKPERPGGRA